jgi:hypothetical protein
MPDGHVNKCIICNKKDVQDRYNNPIAIQRIREYERERFKNPERKRKILEYNRKRAKSHRGKEKARSAIARAIKYGRLKRLPCEVCGDINSQAHHEDYRKKLEVKWLCFKHHREAHGQKVYD